MRTHFPSPRALRGARAAIFTLTRLEDALWISALFTAATVHMHAPFKSEKKNINKSINQKRGEKTGRHYYNYHQKTHNCRYWKRGKYSPCHESRAHTSVAKKPHTREAWWILVSSFLSSPLSFPPLSFPSYALSFSVFPLIPLTHPLNSLLSLSLSLSQALRWIGSGSYFGYQRDIL